MSFAGWLEVVLRLRGSDARAAGDLRPRQVCLDGTSGLQMETSDVFTSIRERWRELGGDEMENWGEEGEMV